MMKKRYWANVSEACTRRAKPAEKDEEENFEYGGEQEAAHGEPVTFFEREQRSLQKRCSHLRPEQLV